MTSPHVEAEAETSRASQRRPPRTAAKVRASVLVVLLVLSLVVVGIFGLPDTASLRARVEDAGVLGWLVFVGGYALITMLPTPKGVLTALGGAVFGLWLGAALALMASLIAAAIAFQVARWLGRDAVGRLARGRLAQADEQLSDHGFGAVLTARLIPVLPFTLVNYASGVSGMRFRDFLTASAVGILPGSLAYAAAGAYGSDPLSLFAALAALVLLVLLTGWWGRRRRAGRSETTPAG